MEEKWLQNPYLRALCHLTGTIPVPYNHGLEGYRVNIRYPFQGISKIPSHERPPNLSRPPLRGLAVRCALRHYGGSNKGMQAINGNFRRITIQAEIQIPPQIMSDGKR